MSDADRIVETELRLNVLEMVLGHLIANYLIPAETKWSEHFKKTLIEASGKIDQESVSGPIDVDELKGGLALDQLQLTMAHFLARVEKTELQARENAGMAQVEPVANKLLSELGGVSFFHNSS